MSPPLNENLLARIEAFVEVATKAIRWEPTDVEKFTLGRLYDNVVRNYNEVGKLGIHEAIINRIQPLSSDEKFKACCQKIPGRIKKTDFGIMIDSVLAGKSTESILAEQTRRSFPAEHARRGRAR